MQQILDLIYYNYFQKIRENNTKPLNNLENEFVSKLTPDLKMHYLKLEEFLTSVAAYEEKHAFEEGMKTMLRLIVALL